MESTLINSRCHWVCLQFMIVVFPDYTHYFCCTKASYNGINERLWLYIRQEIVYSSE